MKENSKLERTYQLDGMKKKKKQFEDVNVFNQNKKIHKDQKSPKKERKHVFEKNKVKEEIYSNGYVDNWDTLNDERHVKQERNMKGKKHKLSDDQTVELTQSNAKLSKKQGGKQSTGESSEYGNRAKEVKKYDCTGEKKQQKDRRSSADEMHTCDTCGNNRKHSKYMKTMKTKSEHIENSSENLDEQSVPFNSEKCETAENTENKLRGRNGKKIRRTYVVEDEYEAAGTNEGYSAEIDEEEDLVMYNSDEDEPSQSKGKIRRYIVEEEVIEDSAIDE